MFTAMNELEFEGEGEYELENEAEGESEEFFRRLSRLAVRARQSPALRRIGLTAARNALRTVGGAAGPLGGRLANTLAARLPQSEFEEELETEFAYEGEGETFVSRQPTQAAALMAHLGHAAAEAETEDEAEAFLGALIPMAARLAPHVSPAMMRVTPHLVRGISNVGRTLLNSSTTRPLIRALPTVARNTATTLARQVAAGRRITPQSAVQTLARQTASILGNPQRAVAAYQQSRALDRRYHGAQRRGAPSAAATNRPLPPRGSANRNTGCGCSG
jgi:hypothetical protein